MGKIEGTPETRVRLGFEEGERHHRGDREEKVSTGESPSTRERNPQRLQERRHPVQRRERGSE